MICSNSTPHHLISLRLRLESWASLSESLSAASSGTVRANEDLRQRFPFFSELKIGRRWHIYVVADDHREHEEQPRSISNRADFFEFGGTCRRDRASHRSLRAPLGR